MKNLEMQLRQLKSFIENCTGSAKSLANYTDFKRINECLHYCFPQYENILEINSADEAENIVGVLLQDPQFIEHNKKGKNQYSNTLYTYVRFLRAKQMFGAMSPNVHTNEMDSNATENAIQENVLSTKIPFSIKTIIQHIQDTGLIYTDNLIKRFAFSLMAKRFLILSGLAGSGKTQLALAFANALIAEKKQLCVVSVGADWTNREPLLGFPNALKDDEYVRPESGVLDLLIEANKEENLNKPYFLILDEMNMSYVERYFADFLSVMESGEGISLWKGSENHPVPLLFHCQRICSLSVLSMWMKLRICSRQRCLTERM